MNDRQWDCLCAIIDEIARLQCNIAGTIPPDAGLTHPDDKAAYDTVLRMERKLLAMRRSQRGGAQG